MLAALLRSFPNVYAINIYIYIYMYIYIYILFRSPKPFKGYEGSDQEDNRFVIFMLTYRLEAVCHWWNDDETHWFKVLKRWQNKLHLGESAVKQFVSIVRKHIGSEARKQWGTIDIAADSLIMYISILVLWYYHTFISLNYFWSYLRHSNSPSLNGVHKHVIFLYKWRNPKFALNIKGLCRLI